MPGDDNETKPISLFYSYSDKDERLRLKLEDHLAVLKRSGMIAEWHDRKIEAGREWENEIDHHLSSADIILLLVSASFIASDYCWSVEVRKALERHARGEARVIPVILRSCQWQITPFAKLQATPKDAKPVIRWSDRDAAFNDVASKIAAVVGELHRNAGKASGQVPTGVEPAHAGRGGQGSPTPIYKTIYNVFATAEANREAEEELLARLNKIERTLAPRSLSSQQLAMLTDAMTRDTLGKEFSSKRTQTTKRRYRLLSSSLKRCNMQDGKFSIGAHLTRGR